MSHQKTVAAPVVKAIINGLEELDFSAGNACRYVGINLNELNLPHGRITEKDFFNLMSMVNNLCNKPSLAIELGERILPTALGIFGFSLLTTETCRDLLERINKHQEFVSDTLTLELKKLTEHYEIRFKFASSNTDTDHFIIDMTMSGITKMIRWILGGNDINPIECLFIRPTPSNIKDYEKYFNCPLKFDAPSNCIKLPLEVLEKLNPSHHKELNQINNHEFQRVLNASSQPSIVYRVREEIKGLLPQGEIAMDMVAKKYNFSERTLLRRLKEEGWTFQTLVDDTRKEVAKQLIEKTSLSLQEITFALGFKDASTFYRAFKRWYHVTPSQHRKTFAANPEYSTDSEIRSDLDQIHKSNHL